MQNFFRKKLYNNTASNTGSDQRHPLTALQKIIQATEKWKVPSRIWHVSITKWQSRYYQNHISGK